MGRCPGLNSRGGCLGSLDASTDYCSLIPSRGLTYRRATLGDLHGKPKET
jgi:hypothetical protein